MRTSYTLLQSYISLSVSPQELAESLTQKGLEVESLLPYGKGLEAFKTAKVLSKTSHPTADNLSVCKISTGKESHEVVCGASNFNVDDMVVFAPPGAFLPDGTNIQTATIRGVISEGMLCSGKELGLFESQEGLWILPKETPIGISLPEWMPQLQDWIFDIAITPNRGDCLSTLGIAREVALIQKETFYPSPPTSLGKKESSWDVQVISPDCSRYLAFVVRHVQVQESPLWLKMALKKYGLRSINNIVDISNYVMMEQGTPVHIFDLDSLHFPLKIRNAEKGEKISLLTGEEIVVPEGTLVISDAKEIMALGGIMGGIKSGVSPSTTNLFIELAHFNPDSIRQTSKILNLHTDASYRFIRNVDIESLSSSMEFLLEQLFKTTPGEFVSVKDFRSSIPNPTTISLSLDFVQKKLGFPLSQKNMEESLSLLNFAYKQPTPKTYEITIPSYRNDCKIDIDVVEELIRVYGYDKLPSRTPSHSFPSNHRADTFLPLELFVRDILTFEGVQEIYNFSFLTKEKNNFFSLLGEQSIPLENPLNSDFSHLRTSLLAGASSYIKEMFEQGHSTFNIFEIGSIFYQKPDSTLEEKKHLLLAKSGIKTPPSFLGKRESVTFYDLKNSLYALFTHLGVAEYITYLPSSAYPFLHPHKTAQIFYKENLIGYIGEIHPEFERDLKKKERLIVSEIDLSTHLDITSSLQAERTFHRLSRFPKSERDLSFILEKTQMAQEILNFIHGTSPLIIEVQLVDQYEDEKLGKNKKNLSFRILFQSTEKTLTDEEIQPVIENIVTWVQKQKNGVLREF